MTDLDVVAIGTKIICPNCKTEVTKVIKPIFKWFSNDFFETTENFDKLKGCCKNCETPIYNRKEKKLHTEIT